MDTIPKNNVMDLTRTFGQVLVASFIATAFWGMTCMQTLMYYVTYESDWWPLKSLVLGLLLLDTAHEVICIQGLWTILIPRFGDLVNVTVVHTPFALEPLLTGIIALMAQAFFAWRIWSFCNKNWIFPVALFPLIIGQIVVTVVGIARRIGTNLTFFDAQTRDRKLMLGVNSMVAGTDIIIAVTMFYLLWRGRTNFILPEGRILRIMNAFVSTGLCMAVFALIAIILYAAFPGDLFYVLGSIPLCPLYCNTVLANLNSRRPGRTTRGRLVDVSIPSGKATEPTIPISSLSAPGLNSGIDSVDVTGRGMIDIEGKHRAYDDAVQSDQAKTAYD